MLRILTLAAISLTLTLGACPSKDAAPAPAPAPTTPTQPSMSDQEALIGTWSSGGTTITFNNNGSYNWVEARPCGAPPCPKTTTAGTYEWRSGKLYVVPNGGQAEVLTNSFGWSPRTLMLNSNKRGQSWNLNYAN